MRSQGPCHDVSSAGVVNCMIQRRLALMYSQWRWCPAGFAPVVQLNRLVLHAISKAVAAVTDMLTVVAATDMFMSQQSQTCLCSLLSLQPLQRHAAKHALPRQAWWLHTPGAKVAQNTPRAEPLAYAISPWNVGMALVSSLVMHATTAACRELCRWIN